ncbi:hypothetical protein QR680_002370 [Steinernema hermaphroditum]|uniref:Apple domain-containing protein n=1 Tax=Steinernema hermaphroditum TaxID=289476 RepID=A0AA39H3D0_9BILA|nr:hypothetical protein QR680_002370 [Steinernema hermaphroditum]
MSRFSLATCLFVAFCGALAQYPNPYAMEEAVQGYAAYSGASVKSSGSVMGPTAPMAPPRVPAPARAYGPSRGYRPPPPPVRRDAKSEGQCKFDEGKWEIEPESAISGAIMFDRTTGLSCEECLEKCTQFQDVSSQWVCRSLTYDNRWKICDLFAINGTSSPYYLAEYPGRDYFSYLAALPPTDAQVQGKGAEATGAAPGPIGNTVEEYESENGQKATVPAPTETHPKETEEKKPETTEEPVKPTEEAHQTSSPAPEQESEIKETTAAPASTAPLASHEESAPAPSGETAAPSSGEAPAPSSGEAPAPTSVEAPAPSSAEAPAPNSVEESAPSTPSAVNKEGPYQAVERNIVDKSGVSLCDRGETPRYTEFTGHERVNPGTETEIVEAKTRDECTSACDRDQLFTCASAVFSPTGCELSSTTANHSTLDSLVESSSGAYLEKVCLPEKLATGTRKIFPAVPNHILVGHVQEVADAKSIRECQIACLRADQDFGFICKSAMWYPSDEDQNCLLNSNNRDSVPDSFVPEDQGVQMVYFDVVREDGFDFKRLKDRPVGGSDGGFTRWSACKDMNGMRHRYQKCQKKDVRKCKKESVMCRHLPALQINKIDPASCMAVRDAQGRKRCPHGMRINAAGRREYCNKPVDC